MDADDIAQVLDGLVHEPTQVHEDRVHLTVGQIHTLRTPGEIDFGGSELQAADTDTLTPKKRDPGDDHGWWELAHGRYLIRYNEAIALEHRPLQLEPRDALLEAGAFHPTITVAQGLPRVPLAVPGPGLQIKENARVSTLRIPQPGR